MNTQLNTFRRIVTGHDADGKAHVVPDSTYRLAVKLLGQDGEAELFFLIGGYCLIANLLNGFDVPAPVVSTPGHEM